MHEKFKLELDKIPDLKTYRKGLEELLSIESSLTQDEIEKIFYEKAILFPMPIATDTCSTINSLTAFRVRLNVKENEEDVNLIRTFSYPNPCFCNENGRANLKNKTVFYCADIPETALAEKKLVNREDVGYLSIWKINCDRNVNYIAFFPSTIPTNNPWYKEAVELQKQLIEQVRHFGNEKSEQLIQLYEAVSKIFITEISPYTVTSWMANRYLYKSMKGMGLTTLFIQALQPTIQHAISFFIQILLIII
jgi:hypothetical protein